MVLLILDRVLPQRYRHLPISNFLFAGIGVLIGMTISFGFPLWLGYAQAHPGWVLAWAAAHTAVAPSVVEHHGNFRSALRARRLPRGTTDAVVSSFGTISLLMVCLFAIGRWLSP